MRRESRRYERPFILGCFPSATFSFHWHLFSFSFSSHPSSPLLFSSSASTAIPSPIFPSPLISYWFSQLHPNRRRTSLRWARHARDLRRRLFSTAIPACWTTYILPTSDTRGAMELKGRWTSVERKCYPHATPFLAGYSNSGLQSRGHEHFLIIRVKCCATDQKPTSSNSVLRLQIHGTSESPLAWLISLESSRIQHWTEQRKTISHWPGHGSLLYAKTYTFREAAYYD